MKPLEEYTREELIAVIKDVRAEAWCALADGREMWEFHHHLKNIQVATKFVGNS